MSFFKEELKEGEIRTIFSVVVSDDKRWTNEELLSYIEDGRIDWNPEFHVELLASWGPIKETKSAL